MTWIKTNSLEAYLRWSICLLLIPLFLVIVFVMPNHWFFWLIIALAFVISYWRINCIVDKASSAFKRASLHIDAITLEDYNQHAKAVFKQGQVAEFHQQLSALSENLQANKARYDQHVFLVYQLIEQLESPIMVFNNKQQLSFANAAFYQLYQQPWQIFRHSLPELLNLSVENNHWQFKDQNKNKQWQIRQSHFIEGGENHQLIIFINIASVLRENQINAWQQIIRVLGHEIRNSLTPVSSIAESLAVKAEQPREQQALAVIAERCQHLQDFVDRYSTLSKQLNLNCQQIPVPHIQTVLASLFADQNILVKSSATHIWGDQTFIDQVFINLVKNAFEASASEVSIFISHHDNQYHIQVVDNGHGFANLDNVFVPLYSTKPNGQGLGLNFCRHVIEQHQGSIELGNVRDTQGVEVHIILPANQS